MRYLYSNKHWLINKEYNLDKLLYLMVDRPSIIYYGDFFWRNNKEQYHRDCDLPANVYYYEYGKTCNLYWSKNHELHRDNNKPAHIGYDGIIEYYINDKFINKSEKPK